MNEHVWWYFWKKRIIGFQHNKPAPRLGCKTSTFVSHPTREPWSDKYGWMKYLSLLYVWKLGGVCQKMVVVWMLLILVSVQNGHPHLNQFAARSHSYLNLKEWWYHKSHKVFYCTSSIMRKHLKCLIHASQFACVEWSTTVLRGNRCGWYTGTESGWSFEWMNDTLSTTRIIHCMH